MLAMPEANRMRLWISGGEIIVSLYYFMYQQTYLGGQAALEPLETQYPFRLSLLANLRKDKKIKHRRKITKKHAVLLLTAITWFES